MWVLMFGMVGLGGRESGAYGILASEAIQSLSLALQSIDDIHGRDCLPLGMLCVGDRVPDDVLKEHLENPTSFLVDEARNSLHTTPTSQTADGRLGDALDIVTEYLAVSLGASLSEPLSTFASSSHCGCSKL